MIRRCTALTHHYQMHIHYSEYILIPFALKHSFHRDGFDLSLLEHRFLSMSLYMNVA